MSVRFSHRSVDVNMAGESSNDLNDYPARPESAFSRTLVADTYRDEFVAHTPDTDQLRIDRRTLWVRLVRHHCWKRRFFVTKRGRFGLGPTNTILYDVVALLFGSDVPIVLRHRGSCYNFVGQAYLDGVMDYEGGDAGLDQDIASGKVKPTMFSIQ